MWGVFLGRWLFWNVHCWLPYSDDPWARAPEHDQNFNVSQESLIEYENSHCTGPFNAVLLIVVICNHKMWYYGLAVQLKT